MTFRPFDCHDIYFQLIQDSLPVFRDFADNTIKELRHSWPCKTGTAGQLPLRHFLLSHHRFYEGANFIIHSGQVITYLCSQSLANPATGSNACTCCNPCYHSDTERGEKA